MSRGHSNIDDYYMPPLDIKNVNDDGIENLAMAVVLNACKEYTNVIRSLIRSFDMPLIRRDHEFGMKNLEMWFKSDNFKLYSGGGIDPEKVIYTLKYNTPEKYLTEKEIENGGFHLKEYEESMNNLPVFKVCEEMAKLRSLLTDRGIKWTDESIISRQYWVCVTRVKLSRKSKIDVLNGYCTKGGFNRINRENEGLLQVMVNGMDLEECVEDTAHGVYNYITYLRQED